LQQRANATNTDNQDGKGVSVSLELNYIKMSKPLTYEDLVSPISLFFSCTETSATGIQRFR